MNVNEAFRELDLPRAASADEIKERYRALANERHPDRGGSHESMAALNSARDLALASNETALTERSAVEALTLYMRGQDAAARAQEEYTRLKTSVTDRLLSPFQRLRLTAVAFTGLAGIAAFFATQVAPTEFDAFVFWLPFGVVSAGCAVTAIYLHLRVEYRKALMEALTTEMDRKDIVANLLLESRLGAQFTEDDLAKSIESGALMHSRWMSAGTIGRAISLVGGQDSARMMVGSALMHGLLEERSRVEYGAYQTLLTLTFVEEEESYA